MDLARSIQYKAKKFGIRLPQNYLNLYKKADTFIDFDEVESKSAFREEMKVQDSNFKDREANLGNLIELDLVKNNMGYPFSRVLNDLCIKDSNFKSFKITNVDFSIYGDILISIEIVNDDFRNEIDSKLTPFIFDKFVDVFNDSYAVQIKTLRTSYRPTIKESGKTVTATINADRIDFTYGKLKI